MFTTGQPLVVSDVAADPRFDRATAESTGYVPRSILAVPVLDDGGSIGVLEVLDRRGDGGSGLRDLDLASVFARQAAVAIRASRVERDVAELLRLDAGAARRRTRRPTRQAIDAAVAEIAVGLDDEEGESPVGARRRGRASPARAAPGPGGPGHRDPRRARPPGRPAGAAFVPPVSRPPRLERAVRGGDTGTRSARTVRGAAWTATWAFGDGSGRGLRVAIVDSGVEGDHPAVGGRLVESVAVERRGEDWDVVPTQPADVVGHGTACAGIIHALAPEAELVSVRVLGAGQPGQRRRLRHRPPWAIEAVGGVGGRTCRSRRAATPSSGRSTSSPTRRTSATCCSCRPRTTCRWRATRRCSRPSCRWPPTTCPSADAWFYNPEPPVEFGAYGLNVDVAWRGGTRMVGDRQQLRRAAHRRATRRGSARRTRASRPFETKAILAATADNAR